MHECIFAISWSHRWIEEEKKFLLHYTTHTIQTAKRTKYMYDTVYMYEKYMRVTEDEEDGLSILFRVCTCRCKKAKRNGKIEKFILCSQITSSFHIVVVVVVFIGDGGGGCFCCWRYCVIFFFILEELLCT